jgi:hypothetical protein
MPNKKPFLPVIILETSGERKQASVEISCPKKDLKLLNNKVHGWNHCKNNFKR